MLSVTEILKIGLAQWAILPSSPFHIQPCQFSHKLKDFPTIEQYTSAPKDNVQTGDSFDKCTQIIMKNNSPYCTPSLSYFVNCW